MKVLSWMSFIYAAVFPLAGLFTVVYSIATKSPSRVIVLCIAGAAVTVIASMFFLFVGYITREWAKK